MSGQYPYQGSGQDQSGGYYTTTSGGYEGNEYYDYSQYTEEQSQQNQPEASASSEPPFVCDVCSKKFRTRRDHNKHYKKHDPQIPCMAEPGCPHVTAEQRDMNRHYWTTHKAYAKDNGVPKDDDGYCEPCRQQFTRYDNYLRHMNKYHPQ